MSSDNSFSQWMMKLRADNDQARDAVAVVYHKYAKRLISLARKRLSARIQQKTDPEDVVQSVYRSFFARHAEIAFKLGDWEDLWGLLALITIRKCANRAAYYRAHCRDIVREISVSQFVEATAMWSVVSREPLPEEAVLLADLVEQLMQGLEKDAPILAFRLEGKNTAEISAELSCGTRTVQLVLKRVKVMLRRALESGQEER
jgi:RNA polymerase sigma-70 factor (ECF subfamily)